MGVVLFLGAGASAPTTCPMTDGLRMNVLIKVRKRLEGPIDGGESARLRFLEHVINTTTLDDIEKVYSCTKRLLNAHNRHSGVVLNKMSYTDGRITIHSREVLKALHMLEGIIHEVLFESLVVDEDDVKGIRE